MRPVHAAALAWATLAATAMAAPPLVGSRCVGAALVDPAFRDAAVSTLDELAVRAPGLPADGAVRAHRDAGYRDAQGRAWHQVSAYQVNLGMIGALHADARVLPVAAGWLRWQARHIAASGPARGVALDHWVRADTLEQVLCPAGMAPQRCADVDAYDSTAASTLLFADAYLRRASSAALLREPDVRRALEDAAAALLGLSDARGLTVAKPGHAVVYTMDMAEVVAGWRAWARLQRDAYAQPASAEQTLVLATRAENAMRRELATESGWSVNLGSGPPQRFRWYPDTVAQAWPLLWLPLASGEREHADQLWRRAIAPWQRARALHWATTNVDPEGFWWPAVAVAAQCTGDESNARAWVARARKQWMDPAAPFAWPFQVGDLLWLLWLADPVDPPLAQATLSSQPRNPLDSQEKP